MDFNHLFSGLGGIGQVGPGFRGEEPGLLGIAKEIFPQEAFHAGGVRLDLDPGMGVMGAHILDNGPDGVPGAPLVQSSADRACGIIMVGVPHHGLHADRLAGFIVSIEGGGHNLPLGIPGDHEAKPIVGDAVDTGIVEGEHHVGIGLGNPSGQPQPEAVKHPSDDLSPQGLPVGFADSGLSLPKFGLGNQEIDLIFIGPRLHFLGGPSPGVLSVLHHPGAQCAQGQLHLGRIQEEVSFGALVDGIQGCIGAANPFQLGFHHHPGRVGQFALPVEFEDPGQVFFKDDGQEGGGGLPMESQEGGEGACLLVQDHLHFPVEPGQGVGRDAGGAASQVFQDFGLGSRTLESHGLK